MSVRGGTSGDPSSDSGCPIVGTRYALMDFDAFLIDLHSLAFGICRCILRRKLHSGLMDTFAGQPVERGAEEIFSLSLREDSHGHLKEEQILSRFTSIMQELHRTTKPCIGAVECVQRLKTLGFDIILLSDNPDYATDLVELHKEWLGEVRLACGFDDLRALQAVAGSGGQVAGGRHALRRSVSCQLPPTNDNTYVFAGSEAFAEKCVEAGFTRVARSRSAKVALTGGGGLSAVPPVGCSLPDASDSIGGSSSSARSESSHPDPSEPDDVPLGSQPSAAGPSNSGPGRGAAAAEPSSCRDGGNEELLPCVGDYPKGPEDVDWGGMGLEPVPEIKRPVIVRPFEATGSAELSYWNVCCELREPMNLPGKIVTGYGRGSSVLGIPTANVETTAPVRQSFLPGVYFGWASLPKMAGYEGKVFKMVMSAGYNPYFDNPQMSIEPFIFHEFECSLLGQSIALVIVGFLRSESTFMDCESLVAAIQNDCTIATQHLSSPESLPKESSDFLKCGAHVDGHLCKSLSGLLLHGVE